MVTEQEFWTGAHLPPEHDPAQCSTCRVRTEARLPKVAQVICRWFVMCENPATLMVLHPILGDVPSCQRCQDVVNGVKGR